MLATSLKIQTMKYLLLLVSIIYTTNSFAQDPNPDLFQTWYLNSVQVSDNAPHYLVSEIEPSITPYLTIFENLDFNGEGACNSFDGKFNLLYSDMLETIEYSNSTYDCGFQIHNSFENSYFGFMQLVQDYEITLEGNGMVLTIGTGIFGVAIFKNFTLNTLDFDLIKIEVYPNPSTSIINIKSQNTVITKIELFNSYGQEIKAINNNFETIDISDLSSGVYIMRFFTKLGIINKKILKK